MIRVNAIDTAAFSHYRTRASVAAHVSELHGYDASGARVYTRRTRTDVRTGAVTVTERAF